MKGNDRCPVCRGSGVEEVYGGHGNVLEHECTKAPPYRHYWPTNDWSTPADDFCMHELPSPNADFRCIREKDHPGEHKHVWSPDIREYSHKEDGEKWRQKYLAKLDARRGSPLQIECTSCGHLKHRRIDYSYRCERCAP
jgi:predicted Zn-ribbon and HTH transcriptional regulator